MWHPAGMFAAHALMHLRTAGVVNLDVLFLLLLLRVEGYAALWADAVAVIVFPAGAEGIVGVYMRAVSQNVNECGP